MGTWGEGLYDNDGALDVLGDLFDELDPEESPAHFAGSIALLAMMSPASLGCEDWPERMSSSAHLNALGANARETIEKIAADPDAATEAGSRTEEATRILGNYCNGPRFEVLFSEPGVSQVVDEFASQAAEALDELASQDPSDLYDVSAELAPLGILIELKSQIAPERLGRWRQYFDVCNSATNEERDFFDDYAGRVNMAFDLLLERSS